MEKRVRDFLRERHGLGARGKIPEEWVKGEELGRELGVLEWFPEIGMVEVLCPSCFEIEGRECGPRIGREIVTLNCCGGVFVLGAV